jgi:hypothetical protein
MKYKTNKSFIPDMGSIPDFIVEDKPGETKEEEWLWHINSMRDHDGLRPLKHVPPNIEFKRYTQ